MDLPAGRQVGASKCEVIFERALSCAWKEMTCPHIIYQFLSVTVFFPGLSTVNRFFQLLPALEER